MLDQKNEIKNNMEDTKVKEMDNKNKMTNEVNAEEKNEIQAEFSGKKDSKETEMFEAELLNENELNSEEEIEEEIMIDETCKRCGGINLLKTIISSLVDVGVIGVITFIGLYIFDNILRAFGLFVAEKVSIALIIFAVVTFLYNAIMLATKKHATLGMIVVKVKVTE